MSSISLARFVVVLLAVAVLAGCDSGQAAASSVEITDESTIHLGETTIVDGVSVTFVAIEQDSRCPENEVCVWEGRAFVTLDLDDTRASARVVDPEQSPEAGVRVGNRIVFATALTRPGPDEFAPPVLTVATADAD